MPIIYASFKRENGKWRPEGSLPEITQLGRGIIEIDSYNKDSSHLEMFTSGPADPLLCSPLHLFTAPYDGPEHDPLYI